MYQSIFSYMGRDTGFEPARNRATIYRVNPFTNHAILYGRGNRIRTHIDGFGDRSSTVELYSYNLHTLLYQKLSLKSSFIYYF